MSGDRLSSTGRPVADDCRQITIRQLLSPGECTSRWMPAGAFMALATLEYSDDCVMLRYRWRDDGAPWRSVTQRIKLARDSRHFGGAQCYFVCPGCGRRAWKLYDVGAGRFACRHCGKLTHQSQREGSWLRALRRAIKIRTYLGRSGDISDRFPQRPTRMTLRIYECLLREARRLETLPPEAWLQAGTKNIRLGIRRGTAGASRGSGGRGAQKGARNSGGTSSRSDLLAVKFTWLRRHVCSVQHNLACPNCRRHAVKLHDAGTGRYYCRHCGGLTYESQRVGTWLRGLRRSYKIRKRLGYGPAAMAAFPRRPKWMRRRTYERLRDRALAFEAIPPETWHMLATQNIKVERRSTFRTASLANRR